MQQQIKGNEQQGIKGSKSMQGSVLDTGWVSRVGSGQAEAVSLQQVGRCGNLELGIEVEIAEMIAMLHAQQYAQSQQEIHAVLLQKSLHLLPSFVSSVP